MIFSISSKAILNKFGQLSLLALLSLMLIIPVQAEEKINFPYVSASGEASKKVKPDQAEISVQVKAYATTAQEAVEIANRATNEIVAALQANNYPISVLEASDIRKNAKHQRDKRFNKLGIEGYDVSRDVKIRLENLSAYTAFMNKLITLENVNYANTRFDYSKRDEVAMSLLREAGRDARKKADNMVAGLGATIVSVAAISETPFNNNPAPRFMVQREAAAMSNSQLSDNPNGIFAPAYLELEQRLHVDYSITRTFNNAP